MAEAVGEGKRNEVKLRQDGEFKMAGLLNMAASDSTLGIK